VVIDIPYECLPSLKKRAMKPNASSTIAPDTTTPGCAAPAMKTLARTKAMPRYFTLILLKLKELIPAAAERKL
jgi:hypothetical protein